MGQLELELNAGFLGSIDPVDGITLLTDDKIESLQVHSYMRAQGIPFLDIQYTGNVSEYPKLIFRDGTNVIRRVGKPAISAFLHERGMNPSP